MKKYMGIHLMRFVNQELRQASLKCIWKGRRQSKYPIETFNATVVVGEDDDEQSNSDNKAKEDVITRYHTILCPIYKDYLWSL